MNRTGLALFLLIPALAGGVWGLAEDVPQKPVAHKTSQANSAQKPRLQDATRVSTKDAVAAAARQQAKKGTSEKQDSTSDAVLEFRPSARDAATTGDKVITTGAKKSALKSLHGDVYGTGGAAGNQEGGKVGTTSKSGKSSIYVETNRSTTNPSH